MTSVDKINVLMGHVPSCACAPCTAGRLAAQAEKVTRDNDELLKLVDSLAATNRELEAEVKRLRDELAKRKP